MKRYTLSLLVLILCLVTVPGHALLKSTYVSSSGKIGYPHFFMQFHTGTSEAGILHDSEWGPVLPYLGYVWLEEGYAHFNDDGSVVSLSVFVEYEGVEYAFAPNVTVYGFMERCLAIWQVVPQVIPIIELTAIDNIASIDYNQLKVYISGLSGWLKTYDKQCLLVIGGEFNFPEGMDGWGRIQYINGTWITKKAKPDDYIRAMKLARQVIDTAQIDNVFLATHANILDIININGEWIRQDWLTEFRGLEEYYEGMREAHVLGFSFYYNESDVSMAWERVRVIRDAVGEEKPVIFIEYANRLWWEPHPILAAEFVNASYNQLEHHKFVKGIGWHLWPQFCDNDTFTAIAKNAGIWERK